MTLTPHVLTSGSTLVNGDQPHHLRMATEDSMPEGMPSSWHADILCKCAVSIFTGRRGGGIYHLSPLLKSRSVSAQPL